MDEPLLSVTGLTVRYPVGRVGFWGQHRIFIHAVDDVSFDLYPGETLSLVGESGSGKSTTGRAILRRVEPEQGTIRYAGRDITHLRGLELRKIRRHIQAVFQDPYASLNPRMTVLEIIAEPLVVHGLAASANDARSEVLRLLDLTGLAADSVDLYPHSFSGGQRQRIGIARALALKPEFIVADEPVSALDVSIQAQIINLLRDLQTDLGLSYLFIAHDLSIVRHISNRVAVMYAGQIVELTDRAAIYEDPLHPYTQSLLAAIPIPEPRMAKTRTQRTILKGEFPDPTLPTPGCRFQTRCPFSRPEICSTVRPPLRQVKPGHVVACHFAEDISEHRRSDTVSLRSLPRVD